MNMSLPILSAFGKNATTIFCGKSKKTTKPSSKEFSAKQRRSPKE